VADLGRTSVRLGVLLALAVVALFEVMSLLQGVRSVHRLRSRVTQDVQTRVEGIRPRLLATLARGGPPAWDEAAALAIGLGVAKEVEVLDAQGRVLLSRPTVPPVAHALQAEERARLGSGRPLTVLVQSGRAARSLSYLAFPAGGRTLFLRLASPIGDLQDELQERQQVFFGHLASLGALLLAAVLALLPRSAESKVTSPMALHAYEEAMERLRDRGQEMSERHEAERRRMADVVHEKEALARAGELTAGIVHEVRNGLSTIVGYARLLERSSLPEDPATAARSIREECETLETVVRRFNDFVRLERLNLADFDLARLLTRVVARELRVRAGVTPALVGLDTALVVRADEELLERAFENLVRNAAEAAAAGGRHVEIEAWREGDEVDVRIEDDGPGLSADHPGEVRPFYTTKPGGLGLGLPLARKIVLLHEGTLALEARAPRGARVLVTLPASGPAA
jgi:signal transduction histidine kinase